MRNCHAGLDASGVTFAVYQKPLDFGTTSSLLRLIVVSKSNLVLLRYIIFLSGIQVFCVCVCGVPFYGIFAAFRVMYS